MKLPKYIFFLISAITISTFYQCQSESEAKPQETKDNKTQHIAENTANNTWPPTYSSLKDSFKSGDILLFLGFDITGFGIIYLEHKLDHLPPYTHVGIILDLPERDNMPAGLYFWQAAPPPSPEFPNGFGSDYFKGVPSNGAELISLDTLMQYMDQQVGIEDTLLIFARFLNKPLTKKQEASLIKYAAEVDGRSFSYPISTGMISDYLLGEKGIQSGDESFFCSKLASQSFYNAGIIDSVITNSVLPGHFGQVRDPKAGKKIFFTNGNSLSDTTTISPF